MTWEEFLAALAKAPDGDKLVAAIKAIVQGKDEEIRRKTNELSLAKKATKDLDSNAKSLKERLAKFFDALGIDEDIEDLDAAIAEAVKVAKKGGDDALLKRLEKLERERKKDKEESDKLITEERAKRHDLLKRQTILSALNAGEAARAEDLVGLLTGMVQLGDDDSLTFINEKGEAVKVEDGVKAWLNTRPEFKKNPQNAGAGSHGGAGGGGGEGSFGKQLAEQNAAAQKAATEAQSHYFK